MVHIYIGNGKGKTSAALGLALRFCGWGNRVYVAQFLKGRKAPCGEINAIKKSGLNIKIERFDSQVHPFFLKDKSKFDPAETRESIEKALCRVEGLVEEKKFRLFVLDEILDALAAGFVSTERFLSFMEKAKDVEVALTGRGAPAKVIKMADYVSFIIKAKHPFDRKIGARKGVEY